MKIHLLVYPVNVSTPFSDDYLLFVAWDHTRDSAHSPTWTWILLFWHCAMKSSEQAFDRLMQQSSSTAELKRSERNSDDKSA